MFYYKKINNEKGLTLIEILTVIVILGILLVVFFPNMNSFTINSKTDTIETDMRLLRSNLQEHFVDNPGEPLTKERIEEYIGMEVDELSTVGSDPFKYRISEKKDSWGNPYELIIGNFPEQFVLIHSFGMDGVDAIPGNKLNTNIEDDIIVLYYPQP